MNSIDYWMIALAAVIATWCAAAFHTIGGRLLHDHMMRRLDDCRANGLSTAMAGNDHRALTQVRNAVRFSPPGMLDAVIMDEAQPEWLRNCLAGVMLERHGLARIVRTAARSSWHHGKWRRIVAWEILLRTGSSAPHALLRKALHESDPLLTLAAARMLGSLRDEPAAHILVDALRAGACAGRVVAIQFEHFDDAVRADVALPLLADSRWQIRFWGISLLAGLSSVSKLDQRLALLASDRAPRIRKAVAQAMGEIGSPAAVATLRALLQDNVGFVRANAVRALHRIIVLHQDPELLRLLPPLQNDHDWWVRLACREALAAGLLSGPSERTNPAPTATSPRMTDDPGATAGIARQRANLMESPS